MNFIFSTTNNIEGGKIKQYIDVICSNTVVGTNFLSDFKASFIDFFGGRSGSYKNKLESIYEEAKKELKQKAIQIGANAIVGFHIDFDEISGKDKSMFMVSASGTACLIELDSDAYDNSHKINVNKSDVDDELKKRMIVKNLNNVYSFKKEWEDIIVKLHPQEAIKPLIHLFLKACKDDSDMSKELEAVLSTYPTDMVVKVIYDEYESLNYNDDICNIIVDCDFFDAKRIMDICSKNFRHGIKLLRALKNSYDHEDLDLMKDIESFFDSLPDTGRIEKVKSGILKKENEMFICENGHKSSRDSDFCENFNCGVNIKGLTKNDINTINNFKNRISAIELLLNK